MQRSIVDVQDTAEVMIADGGGGGDGRDGGEGAEEGATFRECRRVKVRSRLAACSCQA